MLSETELNIFAVIGNPISYSQSPCVMNAAFRSLDLHATYLRMAVETEDDAIETIHRLGISGCNITAPLKNSFIPFLSETDDRSKKIGCVNTILRKGNELIGYNTDVNGIFSSLNQYLDKTDDLFALIIGTGGAARSAIYTAKKMKMNVFLCGRDFEKTLSLASKTGCQAVKAERVQQTANICAVVISTVPRDADLIKDLKFNRWHVVLDSVYPNLSLQHQVESNGGIYIAAENWLLYQACPAFKIFTDEDAPMQAMESALMDAQQNKSPKYFTIMGLSNDRITEIAQQMSPFFDHRVVEMDGVLLPMLALQDLPDNDEKTLIACGLDQLSDKDLCKFIKNNTFSFWIDEGNSHHNFELYLKSIPFFSQLADTLIPAYQKPAEKIVRLLQQEISIL